MVTPTSSPTPLAVTVTAPPATVPSTVCLARLACASSSCCCICCACWRRAFMSKPPPRASKGFWVIGSPGEIEGAGWRGTSVVPDLLDQPGAERLAEEGLGVEGRRLGVAVVVAVDVVVGRPDRLGGLHRTTGARGLERLAGRRCGD